MQSAEVSYAENSFALEKDSYGEELHSVYRQDCLGFTVDNFIKQYNMKIPNYIKIDVDGIENLILQGAADTLLADSLRSVSIEVNEVLKDQVDQICNIMKKSGYKNVIKRHPPYYDDHYYKPFFNYHFFKE